MADEKNSRILLLLQTGPALLAVSILSYVALAAILFGLAGRFDLPWLWATLIVVAVSHLVMVLAVFRHDPGLTRERIKPGPGVPLWDTIVLKLSVLLMLAIMAIALLDVGRWHWSDSVPPIIQGLGLLHLILGMSLMTWSMAVNTFFSKVVRIQDDRGHKVIDEGPYRFVRHPGYVGWTLLWLGFILAIGSWFAFGLSILGVAAIVLRTYLEDRFLKANLDGYADYASRVKWRLIPGIW